MRFPGVEKPNPGQMSVVDVVVVVKEVKSEEGAVGAEVVVKKEGKAEVNEENEAKEGNGEVEVKKEEAEEVAEVGENIATADVKKKNQKWRLKKKTKLVRFF